MENYRKWLEKKQFNQYSVGFDADEMVFGQFNDGLFDFQKQIVKWACKKGRACVFADTGLGKTRIQLAWAYHVWQYTGNRVLILAPLCVANQTVQEAEKINISIQYVRSQPKETGIFITNYEMLENFDLESGWFDGLILDESSIIKNFASKTTSKIIQASKNIPYRLSCTATPSPNDFMELGNQCEFLGIMSTNEMLAQFFTHDSGETQKWRLKGHGRSKFWEFMATWAVCLSKPSDIGFQQSGYDLPPIKIFENHIETNKKIDQSSLFYEAKTLSERLQARRVTIDDRANAAAKMINNSKETWIVWCNLNAEGDLLQKLIPESVQIQGSDKLEKKEKAAIDFVNGKTRVLISKASIFGYGLNFQNCHNMAFVGMTDSYEDIYQAVRRCYRFGQTNTVNVHYFISSIEQSVLENIKRKEKQHEQMKKQMIDIMRNLSIEEIRGTQTIKTEYEAKTRMEMPKWIM